MALKKKKAASQEATTYDNLWAKASTKLKLDISNYLNYVQQSTEDLPLTKGEKKNLFKMAEKVAYEEYLSPDFDTNYKTLYQSDSGTGLDVGNYLKSLTPGESDSDMYLNIARRLFNSSYNSYRGSNVVDQKYFTFNPNFSFNDYDYYNGGARFNTIYGSMSNVDRGKAVASSMYNAIKRFTDLGDLVGDYLLAGITADDMKEYNKYKYLLMSLSENFNPETDLPLLRKIAANIGFDLNKFNSLFPSSPQPLSGNQPAGATILPETEFTLPGYELTKNADGTYKISIPKADGTKALLSAPIGGIFYDDLESPNYGKAYYTDLNGVLHVGSLEEIIQDEKSKTNPAFLNSLSNLTDFYNSRIGRTFNGKSYNELPANFNYFNPSSMVGPLPVSAIKKYSPEYLDEHGGYHYVDLSDMFDGDDLYFALLPKSFDLNLTIPWIDLKNSPLYKINSDGSMVTKLDGPRKLNFNRDKNLAQLVYKNTINPQGLADNLQNILIENNRPIAESAKQNFEKIKQYSVDAQIINLFESLKRPLGNKPSDWYDYAAKAILLYLILSRNTDKLSRKTLYKRSNKDGILAQFTREEAFKKIVDVLLDSNQYLSKITSHKQGGVLKFLSGSFEDWVKSLDVPQASDQEYLKNLLLSQADEERKYDIAQSLQGKTPSEIDFALDDPFKDFSEQDIRYLFGSLTELAGYIGSLFTKEPIGDAASAITSMAGIHVSGNAANIPLTELIPRYGMAALNMLPGGALAGISKLFPKLLLHPGWIKALAILSYGAGVGSSGVDMINLIVNFNDLARTNGGYTKAAATREGINLLTTIGKDLALLFPSLKTISRFKESGQLGTTGRLTKGATVEVSTITPENTSIKNRIILNKDDLERVLSAKAVDGKSIQKVQEEILLEIALKTGQLLNGTVSLKSPISTRNWVAKMFNKNGATDFNDVVLIDPAERDLEINTWWNKINGIKNNTLESEAKNNAIKQLERMKNRNKVPSILMAPKATSTPAVPMNKLGAKLVPKGDWGLKTWDPEDLDILRRVGYDDAAHAAHSEWVRRFNLPSTDKDYFDDTDRGNVLFNNRGMTADPMTAYSFLTSLKDYLTSINPKTQLPYDLSDARAAYKKWKTQHPSGSYELFLLYYNDIVDKLVATKKENWGTALGTSSVEIGQFNTGHHDIYGSYFLNYDPALAPVAGSSFKLRMPNLRPAGKTSVDANLEETVTENNPGKIFYIDSNGHILFRTNGGDKTIVKTPDEHTITQGDKKSDLDIDIDLLRETSPLRPLRGLENMLKIPMNTMASIANRLHAGKAARDLYKATINLKVPLETPHTKYVKVGSDYLPLQLLDKQENNLNWQFSKLINNTADLGRNEQAYEKLREGISQIEDKKAATKSLATQRSELMVQDANNYNTKEAIISRNANNKALTAQDNLIENARAELSAREHAASLEFNKNLVEILSKEGLDRAEDASDVLHAINRRRGIETESKLLSEYLNATNVKNSDAYKKYLSRMKSLFAALGLSPSLQTQDAFNAYIKLAGNTFEDSPEYTSYENNAQEAYTEYITKMRALKEQLALDELEANRTNRGYLYYRDLLGPFYRTNRLRLLNSNLVAPRRVSSTQTSAPRLRAKNGGTLGDKYLRLVALNEKKRHNENKKSLEESRRHDRKVAGTLNDLTKRDLILLKQMFG